MPLSRFEAPLRPVALVLWCGVWLALTVFLLSPPEAVPGEEVVFRSDKLLHIAAFAAITASAAAFCRTVWALAVVSLLVLVAGGLLEWAQAAVPERTASLPDFAANLYGGAVGFVLGALWVIGRRRRHRRRRAE